METTSVTPFKNLRLPQKGFTIIEVVMVILLLGILSAVSISTLNDSVDEARFNATQDKLNQLRAAIIGNTDLNSAGQRTHFGFLGDIGAIPTNGQGLAALSTNPALPAYSINATTRMSVGWNGPYVVTGQPGVDYTKDAWGFALVYDATASPPIVKSLGKANAVGGSGYYSDIIVQLPTTLTTATVDGFLSNNDGSAFAAAAEVEINYPNGAGVLTSALVTLVGGDKGHFQFTAIPFGIRSISAYKGSKAVPTATISNILVTVGRPNVLVPGDSLKWP